MNSPKNNDAGILEPIAVNAQARRFDAHTPVQTGYIVNRCSGTSFTHFQSKSGSLLKGAIFPFDKIPRVQRAIWQGGRDDLINSPIVDSDWIGGFELLLHLGFRLGKVSMCL